MLIHLYEKIIKQPPQEVKQSGEKPMITKIRQKNSNKSVNN